MNKRIKGMELFYIHPIILGGSKGKENIIFVDRQKHIELVRFWNREIRKILEGDVAKISNVSSI